MGIFYQGKLGKVEVGEMRQAMESRIVMGRPDDVM